MNTDIKVTYRSELMNRHLSENGTVSWLQMGMASRKGNKVRQQTPFFRCREFMNDIAAYARNGLPFNTGSFNYNPETMPIQQDKTVMLIKVANRDEYVEQAKSILNPYEEQCGYALTTFTEVHLPPTTIGSHGETENYGWAFGGNKWKVYLVEADKRWQSSCPMLSLFTQLLRYSWFKIDVTKSFKDNLSRIGNQVVSGPDNRMVSKLQTFFLKDIDIIAVMMNNQKVLFRSVFGVKGQTLKNPGPVHSNGGVHPFLHNYITLRDAAKGRDHQTQVFVNERMKRATGGLWARALYKLLEGKPYKVTAPKPKPVSRARQQEVSALWSPF